MKRLRTMANVNKIQFGFMPGKGTTDAVFILRMQEEYCGRLKLYSLYMYFVDVEKAFDGVPRKVIEWSLKKKGVPETTVRRCDGNAYEVNLATFIHGDHTG